MKYIRTKDTIVDFDKAFEGGYYDIDGNLYTPNSDGLSVSLIDFDKLFGCKTRKADTIKELCDEWICRDNRGKEYKPYRFYFLDDLYAFIKENRLFEQYTIYGAIWTDKGLIYVAKMNEKGELELL